MKLTRGAARTGFGDMLSMLPDAQLGTADRHLCADTLTFRCRHRGVPFEIYLLRQHENVSSRLERLLYVRLVMQQARQVVLCVASANVKIAQHIGWQY